MDTCSTPRRLPQRLAPPPHAGYLSALLPHPTPSTSTLIAALGVGLAFFGMQLTDTEHPPAAGTALTAALEGFAWRTVAATVVGAVLLVLIQQLLKPYLSNLAG
ncbi:MAG: HPP family protein [Anaerolineae bacterium]